MDLIVHKKEFLKENLFIKKNLLEVLSPTLTSTLPMIDFFSSAGELYAINYLETNLETVIYLFEIKTKNMHTYVSNYPIKIIRVVSEDEMHV